MKMNKAFSEVYPQNKIESLGNNLYSCRICDNVVELPQGSSTTYSFNSYRDTFEAKNYEELLIKIIHTRYTYDDENNLINDFLERGTNDKYSKYRAFVSWAKETAKKIKEVK